MWCIKNFGFQNHQELRSRFQDFLLAYPAGFLAKKDFEAFEMATKILVHSFMSTPVRLQLLLRFICSILGNPCWVCHSSLFFALKETTISASEEIPSRCLAFDQHSFDGKCHFFVVDTCGFHQTRDSKCLRQISVLLRERMIRCHWPNASQNGLCFSLPVFALTSLCLTSVDNPKIIGGSGFLSNCYQGQQTTENC